MTTAGIIASVVFVLTYILIAFEVVHRTKTALLGAVVMLLLRLVDQHHAFHGTHDVLGIDWNTVFLLIAMMTIASTTGRTGAFQWVAIKAAKLARGHPFWIIVLLSTGTAVLSAGLDNATTVVLMAPVTILICEALEIDPVPYLVFVVLSSNVGGTATLIGDPPNIMIGSQAKLSFVDFLRVDAPIAAVGLLALFGFAWLFVRTRVTVSLRQRAQLSRFDESLAITDPRLLRKSAIIGLLTLGAFCVHDVIHLEPATIALAGATLLMLLHDNPIEEVFHGVEWGTIFFIIGLFVMVSALVDTGVVGLFSTALLAFTGDNVLLLTMGVLVVSAVVSGLIGNIAYVAAMNAVLLNLAAAKHPELTGIAQIQAADMIPVWWALSIGACFGGNSTLLGTAANVAVAGIGERAGYPMGFGRFIKYGVPLTGLTLVLAAIYLWILFF
jgi:Na+/H+ antiporter NhaD/arsenite permease-like protein